MTDNLWEIDEKFLVAVENGQKFPIELLSPAYPKKI
jgi:hypothetical protein